jgi:hypothetical protein
MKTAVMVLSSIALLAAAPSQAQGNGIAHSATGGATIHIGDAAALRTFGFSAVQGSDGSATGQMEIQARQFGNTIHIDVNCLNVVGNVALISGTITQHTDPAEIGTTVGLAVEDNGEGGANAPPDRTTLLFGFPPGTPACMLFGPADAAPFLMPIEGGNIEVR